MIALFFWWLRLSQQLQANESSLSPNPASLFFLSWTLSKWTSLRLFLFHATEQVLEIYYKDSAINMHFKSQMKTGLHLFSWKERFLCFLFYVMSYFFSFIVSTKYSIKPKL